MPTLRLPTWPSSLRLSLSVPDATPEAEAEPELEPEPVLVPASQDRTEVLPPVAAAPVVERVSVKPTPASPTTAPVVADIQPTPTAVVPPVTEPAPATANAFAPVTAAAAAASGTIQAGRVPSSERAPSPFDVFEPEDRRRRWPRRLLDRRWHRARPVRGVRGRVVRAWPTRSRAARASPASTSAA